MGMRAIGISFRRREDRFCEAGVGRPEFGPGRTPGFEGSCRNQGTNSQLADTLSKSLSWRLAEAWARRIIKKNPRNYVYLGCPLQRIASAAVKRKPTTQNVNLPWSYERGRIVRSERRRC